MTSEIPRSDGFPVGRRGLTGSSVREGRKRRVPVVNAMARRECAFSRLVKQANGASGPPSSAPYPQQLVPHALLLQLRYVTPKWARADAQDIIVRRRVSPEGAATPPAEAGQPELLSLIATRSSVQ